MTASDYFGGESAKANCGTLVSQIDHVDFELTKMRRLLVFVRQLCFSSSSARRFLYYAEDIAAISGNIPLPAIWQFEKIDWYSGSESFLGHLQLIGRYLRLYQESKVLRGLIRALAISGVVSWERLRNSIRTLIKNEASINTEELALTGIEPSTFHELMCEEKLDFVEHWFEIRLHYRLNTSLDADEINRVGLTPWDTFRRSHDNISEHLLLMGDLDNFAKDYIWIISAIYDYGYQLTALVGELLLAQQMDDRQLASFFHWMETDSAVGQRTSKHIADLLEIITTPHLGRSVVKSAIGLLRVEHFESLVIPSAMDSSDWYIRPHKSRKYLEDGKSSRGNVVIAKLESKYLQYFLNAVTVTKSDYHGQPIYKNDTRKLRRLVDAAYVLHDLITKPSGEEISLDFRDVWAISHAVSCIAETETPGSWLGIPNRQDENFIEGLAIDMRDATFTKPPFGFVKRVEKHGE